MLARKLAAADLIVRDREIKFLELVKKEFKQSNNPSGTTGHFFEIDSGFRKFICRSRKRFNHVAVMGCYQSGGTGQDSG